jgi:hypothetical protein
MNNKFPFIDREPALLLCAAMLGMVMGCTEPPQAGSAIVAPPPTVIVQDDYVYYPGYEIYYSNNRHQYAYLDNGKWIWSPAPQTVSIDTLRASPSVKMEFHDSPENHHVETLQRYPKNWTPPPR